MTDCQSYFWISADVTLNREIIASGSIRETVCSQTALARSAPKSVPISGTRVSEFCFYLLICTFEPPAVAAVKVRGEQQFARYLCYHLEDRLFRTGRNPGVAALDLKVFVP